MQTKRHRTVRSMLAGLSLAAILAGCSHPPAPVVFVPPPPLVGHPYQVMIQVPAPTTRHVHITPEQQQDVQQAFNVIALKSALMVAALSCNQQDQYDQFMTSFQPHVLAEQHVMDAYFKRIGGYYGQSREDDYITLLANNQSVGGISQGGMFCLNNTAEYKAVLALRSSSDLDNFVTDLPPDATMVAAANPSVTPLSPGDSSINVAVVQSSHHVHLLKTHGTASQRLVVSHGKHRPVASGGVASNVKPVDASDIVSAKPVNMAASVVP